MTGSSITLPTFEVFFKATRYLGYIIGLVPFNLEGETRTFDFFIHIFGAAMTINQLYVNLIFILFIFMEAKTLFDVICMVPLLNLAVESCVKFLFVTKNRALVNELLSDLKFLYQTPWNHQSHAVSELNRHEKYMDKYIYISFIINIIFTYIPLVVTLVVHLAWKKWDPIFVVNGWTAFDKKEHPILAYFIELQAPRYCMSAIIVPDCIMILTIVQLNYHFENLGHAIIEVVKQRGKTNQLKTLGKVVDETQKIKTLKEAVKMHTMLIRYTCMIIFV